MVSGGNFSNFKFNANDLKDVKNIRAINQNSSKELAKYVDEV